MQNYLQNSQFVKQSVVMVDFNNGSSEPIFIAGIETKENKMGVTTRLIGERFQRLIRAPYSFVKIPNSGMDSFYGLGEPNRKLYGVVGYRKITEYEKVFWIEKISPFDQLLDLIKIIQNS